MIPFLETERLFLTRVDQSHVNNVYLGWLNDPEVSKYLESGLFPTSLSDISDFVTGVNEKKSLFLAIHLKENGKHIGNIKVDAFHPIHRTAELGILMGDVDEWGKGYAKEVSISVLTHCFKKINVRKVCCAIVKDNIGSIKAYKKIGFVEEGIFINQGFYDGKYRDIVRLGLFADDWQYF